MKLIALGANLPWRGLTPQETLTAALGRLAAAGVRVVRQSSWYRSAPVPPSGQPDFVNGAALVETGLNPGELLTQLHAVEAAFARARGVLNAARTIDLDLLDVDGEVSTGWPVLPHPRLHQRLFVLLPLQEIVPAWRHPTTRLTLDEMIASAPGDQVIRRTVL